MIENDFLDRTAEYVHNELAKVGGDVSNLEIPLQTIAILYTVQALVDNGGFQSLFERDFPFYPPYSLFSEAYRRIGATRAADCLDQAVALFPFKTPHLFQQKRNEFMESLEESHKLFELGDQVCGDETVWSALQDYAHKNAAAVQLM